MRKNFDVCYIVNNFENEIKESKELENFLISFSSVFHIVGRDMSSLMSEKTYKKLKIKKVILNILRPEYEGSYPFFESSRSKLFLNNMGIENHHLPDSILKYSINPKADNGKAAFPTTGICCIGYVLSSHRCGSITTLGIDFYKSNYFCHSLITREKKPTENQVSKGNRMIDHVKNIASLSREVNFKIITTSNNLENVFQSSKNIKLKEIK